VVKAFAPAARHFRRGTRPVHPAAKEEQARPRVALFTRKTEQAQLAVGVRTCSRHDERRFAVRLLNALLGENMSSRLFQVLREELGLAYSVYSTPSFFSDTGDLVIYAGLDAKNLAKALRLILRELENLRRKGPGSKELERARDYILGHIDLSLEGTENQMNWVGEQMLSYGRVLTPAELKRRLTRVSTADVRRVAVDFFQRDRLNMALVSVVKSASEYERLIERAL
jgi:predicted Zn-dependent peptidase